MPIFSIRTRCDSHCECENHKPIQSEDFPSLSEARMDLIKTMGLIPQGSLSVEEIEGALRYYPDLVSHRLNVLPRIVAKAKALAEQAKGLVAHSRYPLALDLEEFANMRVLELEGEFGSLLAYQKAKQPPLRTCPSCGREGFGVEAFGCDLPGCNY